MTEHQDSIGHAGHARVSIATAQPQLRASRFNQAKAAPAIADAAIDREVVCFVGVVVRCDRPVAIEQQIQTDHACQGCIKGDARCGCCRNVST